jgi:hypothetical protein
MKTAGDLLIDAVDVHFEHLMACPLAECRTCDVGINRLRLAHKVWRNSRHKELSDSADRQLLKQLVITHDAEQDDEFTDAMREARARLGLTLADDADIALTQLRRQHAADADDDDRMEPFE